MAAKQKTIYVYDDFIFNTSTIEAMRPAFNLCYD